MATSKLHRFSHTYVICVHLLRYAWDCETSTTRVTNFPSEPPLLGSFRSHIGSVSVSRGGELGGVKIDVNVEDGGFKYEEQCSHSD